MSISQSTINEAAKRLRNAAELRKSCKPVRDLIGETDLRTAYAVQRINNDQLIRAGHKVVGSKIGLTSESVQKQLGVDQPDYGLLFDYMEVLNGGEIAWTDVMQPKAEAEIAFILSKDLAGSNLTETDIIDAVDYAVAAIEIVGSRIGNWNIRITDTIADNASSSHFVLGKKKMKLDAVDLINCKMLMKKNGNLVSEGKGEACLGSPVIAALWLARTMAEHGSPLKAGDIILTGALGPMSNVEPRDKLEAEIEGLGKVSVRFGKS